VRRVLIRKVSDPSLAAEVPSLQDGSSYCAVANISLGFVAVGCGIVVGLGMIPIRSVVEGRSRGIWYLSVQMNIACCEGSLIARLKQTEGKRRVGIGVKGRGPDTG
jgi:hypothetical protein